MVIAQKIKTEDNGDFIFALSINVQNNKGKVIEKIKFELVAEIPAERIHVSLATIAWRHKNKTIQKLFESAAEHFLAKHARLIVCLPSCTCETNRMLVIQFGSQEDSAATNSL